MHAPPHHIRYMQHNQTLHNASPPLPANNACRGQQEEIINATLSGRDVFVLMPTGGGKVCAPCQSTSAWHATTGFGENTVGVGPPIWAYRFWRNSFYESQHHGCALKNWLAGPAGHCLGRIDTLLARSSLYMSRSKCLNALVSSSSFPHSVSGLHHQQVTAR
eukprot:scaffold50139_cov22-Tisochrysis_lutea.AAC.3